MNIIYINYLCNIKMNYWIEICKYRVNRWYLRAKNSCDKCNELYLDVNDYVIENRIIF